MRALTWSADVACLNFPLDFCNSPNCSCASLAAVNTILMDSVCWKKETESEKISKKRNGYVYSTIKNSYV